MIDIKVGDRVVDIVSGVEGVVVKQYIPTACEHQTMIKCDNGLLYHAPTYSFRKIYDTDRRTPPKISITPPTAQMFAAQLHNGGRWSR